jgi:alpha-galactosidase
MRKIILVFFVALVVTTTYAQKYPGLAKTPPMGWNTWNKFACNIDEKLIRQAADEMVSSGLRDAGYTYIVIDDCWHGQRDSLGFIRPNAQTFPSGMKALADYIHSKGLKFGIYSDAGATTCGGRPGSRGHEYQDALTYASWGVDYLKYDWCATDGLNALGAYTTMRDALYAAKRPIVFSMCEWGNNKPWEWAKDIGHLWRTTGDIYPCWDCKHDHGTWFSWGVMKILDMQDGLRKYAGPDHWNDPDMMEVGNGLTLSENRAHFTMWCMLAAPLMVGTDLAKMSPEVKNIFVNKDVIAIDQDTLGIQAWKYASKDSVETWFKPLENGDWALCFLNRSSAKAKIEFDFSTNAVKDDLSGKETTFDKIIYKARDLWTGKEMGTTKKPLKAELPGHDVLMIRLTKQ